MTAMLRLTLPLFLAFTVLAVDGVVAQPIPIDLGTLGGSSSRPLGMNDHGWVVGTSTTSGDSFLGERPFLWTEKGGMVNLSTLGGRSATLSGRGAATAVNNQGQVVGYSFNVFRDPGDLPGAHGFLWTRQDGMVDLHAPPARTDSQAWFINNRGRIVGTYHSLRVRGRLAYSWTPTDGMVDLGTLGGRTEPTAVNNRGQVAGVSYTMNILDDFLPRHAFLWTPTGGMVDLGTLGGPWGQPAAMNEKGYVVGWSYIDDGSTFHAFLWTPTEGMVDLGTLGGMLSRANDVNEEGVVVGCSHTTGDAEFHAFLWTPADGMVDLGTLGGTTSCAVAINDRGQVVGQSDTFLVQDDGFKIPVRHGFVWTASAGMVDLAPLPGQSGSDAFLLNNRGDVVGISGGHATMWRTAPTGAVATSSQ